MTSMTVDLLTKYPTPLALSEYFKLYIAILYIALYDILRRRCKTVLNPKTQLHFFTTVSVVWYQK